MKTLSAIALFTALGVLAPGCVNTAVLAEVPDDATDEHTATADVVSEDHEEQHKDTGGFQDEDPDRDASSLDDH